ncbi:MAG TPA: SIMPL domain-containing protein [Candidatus Competibacter denitrificans]|mgnify:CR=1 FL=1|uniref:SIMPL domain-containing protein n=1 Tax=Candidatus Competibacter denitrificans TaxID=1400862 RepID=UPI0014940ACD|nr:SIMPL domain-containing protein [Candidatus Competibacter denitrificans]HRC70202.1 SIMPL domain-containing protein [Candidatus Competibacter denitrificans]
MKYIFAILLLLQPLVFASAGELPAFPFVFVIGNALKEVPPDLAKVTFEVKSFDENPEKSLDIVQRQTSEVLDFLKKLEVQDKDIEAYQLDKQAIRQEKNGVDLKILGYETKQKILVNLHETKKYSVLVEGLLKYRNIVDIDAKFDVSNRKEIEKSLIADACADAKNKAENMADGIGAKLGSVFSISDQRMEAGYGNYDYMNRMFKKSMYKGESDKLIFIPSTIEIRQNVHVFFKLAEQKI